MSRFVLVCIFTLIVTTTGLTQDSNQQPSPSELRRQLDEVRSQMIKMQNRIAELEASRGISATSSGHDPVLLQNSVTPARTLLSQADDTKIPEEATSFQFKGLSLTPGGFLEGTMLVRSRNENADIANSYSAIPLNGSSNAKRQGLAPSAAARLQTGSYCNIRHAPATKSSSPLDEASIHLR